MRLKKLSLIYAQIKLNNETYGLFNFKTNGITFNVFFDIGKEPFRLGFLPVGKPEQIWLDVNRGFTINPILPKSEYRKLTKLLNLKYDKDNPFSTFSFFKQFGENIPNELIRLSNSDRVSLALKVSNIEDREKTVYLSQTDWNKSNSGKSRTKENLEKTRLLYPDLYNQIKDKNISVNYKVPD